MPVAAMFVSGSGRNEQSLGRTWHKCFLPSLEVCVGIKSGAAYTSFIFHCTGHHFDDVISFYESRLPEASTTYENVCNIIDYSSNRYFSSWWYVL